MIEKSSTFSMKKKKRGQRQINEKGS